MLYRKKSYGNKAKRKFTIINSRTKKKKKANELREEQKMNKNYDHFFSEKLLFTFPFRPLSRS